jgi:hypothetical protein
MGHVLPFQQFARSPLEQTLPGRIPQTQVEGSQTSPRICPYSIKGMSGWLKIEVSEKKFIFGFI